MAGRDDLGGTAKGRLTTAGFGTGATTLNASGSSAETMTMAAANIYQHQHSVYLKDPGHTHNVNALINGTLVASGYYGAGGYASSSGVNSSSSYTGITIGSVSGVANDNATANFGSTTPTPMRTVQPTLISDCIQFVLP